MKPIEDTYKKYKQYEDDTCYLELISSMGYEVILHTSSGPYCGDSWYLLKYGKRYGYLEFGYGSCSACDALQACTSVEELERLRQSLYESIIWHNSLEAMQEWIRNRAWETQWSYNEQALTSFKDKVLRL